MTEGRVEVHGTNFGLLVFGLSMQSLYWYGPDAGARDRRRVVNSLGARRAWECEPCELTTISTTGKETPASRGRS